VRRQRAGRRQRGNLLATMLWFLPFSLFGFTLAWDYTQAIAVTREATLTAEAMANAGATAFAVSSSGTESARLDPAEAKRRATDMCAQAFAADMLRESSKTPTSCQRVNATETFVYVEVPVETRLSMASLLVLILRPGSEPLTVNTVGRARTDLCVPTEGVGGPQPLVNCVYLTNDLL